MELFTNYSVANLVFLISLFIFLLSFQYSSIDSAFHPPSQLTILKASIDLTSRFLVLSDINGNVKINFYDSK